MRTNCVSLKNWLDSQEEEFRAIWAQSKHLIYNYNLAAGTVIISNLRTGKTASASCSPKKFGLSHMIGLAWASYKGEKIPTASGLLEMRLAKDALHPIDYDKRLILYKGRKCKISFATLCGNYIATDLETKENYKISPLAYVQIVY